jgi:hypothetical protein
MASCLITRNWLLGGYTAVFSESVSLNAGDLSRIAAAMFFWLRDALSLKATPAELLDLKGRERTDLVIPELPHPRAEEVFALGGSIATGHTPGGFTWAPFVTSCTTRFKRFEGNRHIVHSYEIHPPENIPEWLPWWMLGSAAPIQLDYARFGFELFSSRFRLTSFGAVPVVSDSLLLDATNDRLVVQLTTNQPRWKPCNPFETNSVFRSTAQAVDSVCRTTLPESFAKELHGSARFSRRFSSS